MTEEKNIRRSHRICPCNPMDIEGIQSWLEDLAAAGLMLETDSIFCGLWSFVKTEPQAVQYRLEVIRSRFADDAAAPDAEMVETAEAMGWTYVTKYHSFYIYRSTDPQARPLHTEPAIEAITIKALRRQQYISLVLDCLYVFAMCFFRRSYSGYLFRSAATIGVFYALCTVILFLYFLLRPVLHLTSLHRAIRRLKQTQALDRKQNWKKHRPWWLIWRLLPICIALVILLALPSALGFATERHQLEYFTGYTPFAGIQEVFPEGTVTSRTDMGDYNTYLTWRTAVSENIEWSESGSITVDGKSYHFILRATSYDTQSQWFARQLAKDCFMEDRTRYHGKRFEMLEAPETGLDYLQVYSSYGIRYVLLQHKNIVIHAAISIDYGQETDLWEQWLQATAAKLICE